LWLHSLKVAQLLRSAACLHTNQSRSYLNHLVIKIFVGENSWLMDSISDITNCLYIWKKVLHYGRTICQNCNETLKGFRESNRTCNTLHYWHLTKVKRSQLFIFETWSTALNSFGSGLCLTVSCTYWP